jgi:hypothetical protein
MNKRIASLSVSLILFSLFSMTAADAQDKKTAAGEEFFIVASLDQANAQLLLKRPTEVTQLAKVSARTQFIDEKAKPLHLTDLRAGDTVWAVTSGSGTNITIARLRKGPMTVAELHQYYLDYPQIK